MAIRKRKHPLALPAKLQAAIVVALACIALFIMLGVPLLTHAHT
jgi:hypothetical protein